MVNSNKNIPSVNDLARAERLREVLEALNEANKKFPVIVEGKKDKGALKSLGVDGEIIVLNRGKNLYEFCEDIAEKFSRVIILVDWDTTGDSLHQSLSENLKGHWEAFSPFREIMKLLCQKDVKDIEGIPKLLSRLEGMRLADNEYAR